MLASTIITATVILVATLPKRSSAIPGFISSRTVTNTSKAGLGWPNGNSSDITQFEKTGKVSWYYTWSAFPVNTTLEFSPMLWGTPSIDQFTSTINQTLSQQNVTAVLGMNEPEQAGQSNLTANAGAQMWKTYLEPLHAQNIRLGSPATSSGPAGKVWLQDFLTACAGACTVDFIALHWYGTNGTQFIEYIQDFYTTFQKPLWVTEWACQNYVQLDQQCSSSDIVSFLNTTQSFMDSAMFVERYAWFGAMKDTQGLNPADALIDSNGQITALGSQYIATEFSTTLNSTGEISINEARSPSVSFLNLAAIISFISFALFRAL